MIEQIPINEQNIIYQGSCLCEFPWSVNEMTEKHGITFTEHADENIGGTQQYNALIKVNNNLLLLEGCGNRDLISIYLYADNRHPNPKKGLDETLDAFGITIPELQWIAKEFPLPTWSLIRQADNNDIEIEMSCFQSEHLAIWFMERYEKRSHKQCYTVRKKGDGGRTVTFPPIK